MPPLFLSGNRNLVIVRAGRKSLHPSWLGGAEQPRFDVLVTAYEEGVPPIGDRENVVTIFVPGRKIAGFNQIFTEHPWIFDDYDRIALFDDDLETDAATINRLFDIGETSDLSIWQPSLAPDSFFSYAVFLQNTSFTLRYSNFIEMMCPVFTAQTLADLRPLFTLGFETGIDLLWCRCFDMPLFKCAVVDAVAVKHTRGVGATAAQQGFTGGRIYDHETAELLEKFGTTFRGPVIYAGVSQDGQLIGRSEEIALKALRQLGHMAKTPMDKRVFLRFVADHVRHCLTRPVNLDKVDAIGQLGGMSAVDRAGAGGQAAA